MRFHHLPGDVKTEADAFGGGGCTGAAGKFLKKFSDVVFFNAISLLYNTIQ
jgi:hypothetical protein